MSGHPTLEPATRARLLARSVRRDTSARDEFAGREAEIAWYLDHAAGRYATTLALLDRALARKHRPPQLRFPRPLYRSFDRERMRREGVILVDES